MTTTPLEIELKLALDPRHAPRLRRQPLLAALKPVRRKLYSQYFDTPDFELMRRGVAFRLRRVGYHWVQTLKAESRSVGALSSRPEWEVAVAGSGPDFAVLPEPALALLAGIDLARIGPVFVTEFQRTTWQIRLGKGSAELALDLGEIRAGAAGQRSASQPISELEIELKSGAADMLFDLAGQLLEQVPLRVEPRSKAERGYILSGAIIPAPVKAVRPDIRPRQAAGEAWAGVVRAALVQLVANVPGFLERPEDTEYLHQLRVALRRLQAAAGLSKSLSRPAPAWLDPLRELMRALNAARDWDVFLHEVLPGIQVALAGDPPAEELQGRMQAAAHRARHLARETIAAPAFTRLVLDVGRGLLAATRLAPPDGEPSAIDWSAEILESRWKNLRKHAKGLAGFGPGGLHQMRIAAKKLRYAADALAPLHGKRAGAFLESLAELQNGLGQSNDLHVAMQLLCELHLHTMAQSFAAGRLHGVLAVQANLHSQVSGATWRRMARARLFWR